MKNQETLFFAGIDWSRNFHQVCVIDHQGSIIGEASFEHSGRGLFEMTQWIREISGSEVCNISVAIEVNHGPVVESLIEQNFRVCSINPKHSTDSGTDSLPLELRMTGKTLWCWPRRFAPTAITSTSLNPRTPR